jgi:hypothetical protein
MSNTIKTVEEIYSDAFFGSKNGATIKEIAYQAIKAYHAQFSTFITAGEIKEAALKRFPVPPEWQLRVQMPMVSHGSLQITQKLSFIEGVKWLLSRQSSMVIGEEEKFHGIRWVKASERLPKRDQQIPLRVDGIYKMGNFFMDDPEGDILLYITGLHGYELPSSKFDHVEWLEEYTTAGKGEPEGPAKLTEWEKKIERFQKGKSNISR